VSDQQSGLFPSHPTEIVGVPRLYRRLILPKYLEAASKDKRLENSARAAHEIILRWAEMETKGRLSKANESKAGGGIHHTGFRAGVALFHFGPERKPTGSFSRSSLCPTALPTR